MSQERDQALGQLILLRRRLANLHRKAGQLLGAIYKEVDTVIGEDFMNKDLKLVKLNADELVRLQNEAKAIETSIAAIQDRYEFDLDSLD